MRDVTKQRVADGRYWLRYRGERLAFVIGRYGHWNVERLDNRLLGVAKTLDEAMMLAITQLREPS